MSDQTAPVPPVESASSVPAVKPKIKRNISDEERARRSAAMKEISAKRLAAIRKDKPPVPTPPPPAAPAAAAVSVPIATPVDDDDDDLIIDRIVQRLKRSAKAKKVLAPEPASESDDEIIKAPVARVVAKPKPKPKAAAKPRSQKEVAVEPEPEPPVVFEPIRRSVRFF